ncbi:MAG: DNA internalization-related competence protein ComEC/Rec2 [Bacilli bacterium]|nr:DNA internalization-related competence protein ComEC/Rec2 [Bacilli bacterium]
MVVNDVLINFYKDDIPSNLKIGDYVKVQGLLSIPNKNTTPHLFCYRNYLYSINIHYILKPSNIKVIKKKVSFIYYIKRNLINYFSKFKSNSYLLTFILGMNDEIKENVASSYNKNGISHLFALSGMHVSLLTCIILFILTKIIKEKKAYLICSLFLVFYLFLTAFSKSIVRASFLFFFLTFKKIFKINLNIKKVYVVFTCLMLIINPYNVYNNAFLYSYIISFALISFGDIINNYKNYFLKIFITSLISFLVGIPVSINASFELNLISPFLNIFFVPVISIIIFPLTLLTAVLPFLDFITFFLMSLIEKISLFCSYINLFKVIMPYMNIKVILLYYLLLIITVYKIRRKNNKCLLIIIIFLIVHYNQNLFNSYTSLTFLDVQQGDSLLINYQSNKGSILIDTGGKVDSSFSYTKNTTIPYLKSLGIHQLNYLILTHGDFDHMGEAINLVNNFKVEKVIFNCGPYNDLEKELIKVLDKKKIKYYSCIKELNIDKNKLYFLQTKEYDNENDNSNVIYTELNGYRFMFMGDASITTEKEILDKYDLPDIDVLKVGHHGSRTSSSKEFIDEINPKYSIISVGKNNRFGHPNKEVLDNLENSKIYRTDIDGSIMFKIRNNKLQIETCSS